MDGFEKRFLWEWAVFSRCCLVLYNAKMAEDFRFSVREGGFKEERDTVGICWFLAWWGPL